MSTRTVRLVDMSRPRARSAWVPAAPYALAALLGLIVGMPFAVVVPSLLGMGMLLGPRIAALFDRGLIELRIAPGRIHLGRLRTIRARDVEGASTARTSDGIAITVKTRSGEPVSFVVDDENVAHEVMAALGVGHSGSGRLWWLLVTRGQARVAFVMDLFVVLAFVIALGTMTSPNVSAGLFMLGFIPMLASVFARTTWRTTASTFAFDPWGVWIMGRRVLWSEMRDAQLHRLGIQILSTNGFAIAPIPEGTMSDVEKQLILEQIRAGIARAHGMGRQKAEPHTRVDMLARRGDDPRKWLARVDAIAADLGSSTYRGATIDPADLWLTLEDPDAPNDLRAAAARVLVRVAPDKKLRIDSLVAAARTDSDEERLRIAMEPDIEEAASKLERLAD